MRHGEGTQVRLFIIHFELSEDENVSNEYKLVFRKLTFARFRFGQMELVMKGNGGKTRLMERANFGMQMETSSKASGKTIKPMEKALTPT